MEAVPGSQDGSSSAQLLHGQQSPGRDPQGVQGAEPCAHCCMAGREGAWGGGEGGEREAGGTAQSPQSGPGW